MSDTKYNGWTNRATWAVALHVGNDQGPYESVHDEVRTILAGEHPAYPDRWAVAERLRDLLDIYLDPRAYIEQMGEDITLQAWLDGPGMMLTDVGNPSEINWAELAESFIADVKED